MTGSRYDADEIEDPYSYRGTACLKNKLGLRDAETLQAFELEMSTLRADEPLPAGRFAPRIIAEFIDIYFRTFTVGPAVTEQLPPQRGAICSAALSLLNAKWFVCSANLSPPLSSWEATAMLSSHQLPSSFRTSMPFIHFELCCIEGSCQHLAAPQQ